MVRIKSLLLVVPLIWAVPAHSEIERALIVELSEVAHGSQSEGQTEVLEYVVGSEDPLEFTLTAALTLRAWPRIREDGDFDISFEWPGKGGRLRTQTVHSGLGERVKLDVHRDSPWIYATVREVVEAPAGRLDERLRPVPLVETTPDMPDVLYDDAAPILPEGLQVAELAPRLPVFVRSDVVLDDDEEVEAQFFLASTRKLLQRWIDESDGSCEKRYEASAIDLGDDGQRRDSLDSAIETADWIVRGRVTGRAPGFSGLLAGTLLRIQPEEILKGSQERQAEHFVFMEVGAFHVGGSKICTPGYLARDHATLPAIGESVLLFVGTRYQNRGTFVHADAEDLITLRASGPVSMPRAFLRSDPALLELDTHELSSYLVARHGAEK